VENGGLHRLDPAERQRGRRMHRVVEFAADCVHHTGLGTAAKPGTAHVTTLAEEE